MEISGRVGVRRENENSGKRDKINLALPVFHLRLNYTGNGLSL